MQVKLNGEPLEEMNCFKYLVVSASGWRLCKGCGAQNG